MKVEKDMDDKYYNTAESGRKNILENSTIASNINNWAPVVKHEEDMASSIELMRMSSPDLQYGKHTAVLRQNFLRSDSVWFPLISEENMYIKIKASSEYLKNLYHRVLAHPDCVYCNEKSTCSAVGKKRKISEGSISELEPVLQENEQESYAEEYKALPKRGHLVSSPSKSQQKKRGRKKKHENAAPQPKTVVRESSTVQEIASKHAHIQESESFLESKGTADLSGTAVKYEDLHIRSSSIHGMGIFTDRAIQQGSLIFEYTGEVIGKCVSDKRELKYKQNGIKSIYMFTINEDMIIDATLKGNKARYMNHSCNPNCMTITYTEEKVVCYYAKHDIMPGEELTINYYYSEKSPEEICNCGDVICKSSSKKIDLS
ncbi:hypothetical protein ENBRE01_0007 [Enteropsectra breve]|nr:hypothetical protein ENBRE01_0007 [Enteropsectra breve]